VLCFIYLFIYLFVCLFILFILLLITGDFGEGSQLEGLGSLSVGPNMGMLPYYAPELLKGNRVTFEIEDVEEGTDRYEKS
jgi:hypothetical protein